MYKEIKAELDQANVTLVAVSKMKPISMIQEMYEQGQRIFGENRVQELVEKHEKMPKDIKWHMIGHLQSKKVKSIIPFISMIHSVDSIKLLKKINKEAAHAGRIVDVLIQFHVADEETKYGFTHAEIDEVIKTLAECGNVRARGIMGMATFTDDQVQVSTEFASLKNRYETMKTQGSLPDTFDTVSMGMSGDYKLAISEGSTMVRIGSLLFGKR